jgi:tetratricopeptide (TPR) repeat protein
MIMRSLPLLFLLALASLSVRAQVDDDARKKVIDGLGIKVRELPPAEVLRYVDSLLAIPEMTAPPLWRMELYSAKGKALRFMRKHDEALAAHAKAFAIADSLQDPWGRKDAQLAIAILHVDLGEVARARRELLDLYNAAKGKYASGDHHIPMMLGALADMDGKPDSAMYWYQRSLTMAEAEHDSTGMANLLFNIAHVHDVQGDDAKNEAALLRTLRVMPAGGYPQLETRVLAVLAGLYLDLGRLKEVPDLLDKAQRMAVEQAAGDVLLDCRLYRIRLLRELGETDKALAEYDRLIRDKDSLGSVMREQALAEEQSRFEVSRIEKELALTKSEAEVNKLRAQRAWIAWGALAVIGALAIVLVILFRRQYLAKKQAAAVLENDKERLLEENELLLQENLMARFETLKSQIDPHFLFNAMNALYTLVETEPKKAREFVSSFSALYRKVLSSRERTIVPVQEELELVHHYLFLQRIRFGESLRVQVQVPAHALMGYLPPFTLQMLLENAIKHNVISAAHPLHITIAVEGDHLIVRNDLLPRATKEIGTGTGLENIRRRYILLGAQEPTFTVADPYYTASVPILSHEP